MIFSNSNSYFQRLIRHAASNVCWQSPPLKFLHFFWPVKLSLFVPTITLQPLSFNCAEWHTPSAHNAWSSWDTCQPQIWSNVYNHSLNSMVTFSIVQQDCWPECAVLTTVPRAQKSVHHWVRLFSGHWSCSWDLTLLQHHTSELPRVFTHLMWHFHRCPVCHLHLYWVTESDFLATSSYSPQQRELHSGILT